MERFTLIETMERQHYSVKKLCVTLEVSRSGYYAHGHKPEGLRRRQDADLKGCIDVALRESRRAYGTRRLRVVLDRGGRSCGRRRLASLMAVSGLSALRKGHYRPRTTQSRHDHPIALNRLLSAEGVPPVAAEQTWVADITYLPTGEGWHYLAAEMNLGSRRIMGWKEPSKGRPSSRPTRRNSIIQTAAANMPPRQLLRQRRDGKLLVHSENRMLPRRSSHRQAAAVAVLLKSLLYQVNSEPTHLKSWE